MFDWWYWNVNGFIFNGVLQTKFISVLKNERLGLWLLLQSLLECFQLMNETNIGMNDWSPTLYILECLLIGHIVVFHEICNAQCRGPRLPCSAIDKDLTTSMVHLLNLVSDQIKVNVQLGSHSVLHRDLNRVLFLIRHGGQLQGGVDDGGDPEVQETLGGDSSACCEVELLCEFTGVGPVIFLTPTVSTAHDHCNKESQESADETLETEDDVLNTVHFFCS